MSKKRAAFPQVPPDLCFVEELAGDTPPSFVAMQRLYGLASDLFALLPWQVLDESQLIVVRDSGSNELCYCSVMGALGEVYSMHAYIGAEGLRTFRKLEGEAMADPGEFFATTRSVYVEFVSRAELEPPDRKLLAALRHPKSHGHASPIFRAIRPGFHPWFVSADEARMLAECIAAVAVVCTVVVSRKNLNLWREAETYPMVTWVEDTEPPFQINLVKSTVPPEPTIPPLYLDEESLHRLLDKDYPVRGKMELDYIFGGVPIGKKNERKRCASVALAVDADTGMVYAPEVIDVSVPCGDALSRVFLKAIRSSRALPTEVRVRSPKLKESLDQIMRSFGVKLHVARRLPAADQARAHLLGFLSGDS
ncbi:MAG TPA: hypothetical protein VEI52_11280 [Terriglobales bacterium]|nr:hypothetical protein [Terriglobales bacterium]